MDAGWNGEPLAGTERLVTLSRLSAMLDPPLPAGRSDRMAAVEVELSRAAQSPYTALGLVEPAQPLRVEFAPLTLDQHVLLFERIAGRLGIELTSGASQQARTRLSRLLALAPGDYTSLLRGRLLLGRTNAEEVLADLERAHAEKRGERRVGFRE